MLRWLDLTGRPVTHVKYGCILCFPFAYVAEIGRFSFNFGPDFEAGFFFFSCSSEINCLLVTRKNSVTAHAV